MTFPSSPTLSPPSTPPVRTRAASQNASPRVGTRVGTRVGQPFLNLTNYSLQPPVPIRVQQRKERSIKDPCQSTIQYLAKCKVPFFPTLMVANISGKLSVFGNYEKIRDTFLEFLLSPDAQQKTENYVKHLSREHALLFDALKAALPKLLEITYTFLFFPDENNFTLNYDDPAHSFAHCMPVSGKAAFLLVDYCLTQNKRVLDNKEALLKLAIRGGSAKTIQPQEIAILSTKMGCEKEKVRFMVHFFYNEVETFEDIFVELRQRFQNSGLGVINRVIFGPEEVQDEFLDRIIGRIRAEGIGAVADLVSRYRSLIFSELARFFNPPHAYPVQYQ